MKGKLDTGSFTDFPEDLPVWGYKYKKGYARFSALVRRLHSLLFLQ